MISTPQRNPPLIAIIDDHECVREAFGRLIRSAGFRTALFESADAFLNSGPLHDTDCVVTDWQMPGMDGLQLVRKLTKMNRRPPAILITAWLDSLVLEAAMKAGAVAAVPKASASTMLIDVVRRAISIEADQP